MNNDTLILIIDTVFDVVEQQLAGNPLLQKLIHLAHVLAKQFLPLIVSKLNAKGVKVA